MSEISEVISEPGLFCWIAFIIQFVVRPRERDDANWKGCGGRCWRDPLDERLIAEFLDFHLTAVSNASQVISPEFHFAATMRTHGCKIAEFSCSLADASRYKLIHQTLKFSPLVYQRRLHISSEWILQCEAGPKVTAFLFCTRNRNFALDNIPITLLTVPCHLSVEKRKFQERFDIASSEI